MRRKDLELRRKNNIKANELLKESVKRELNKEEIEELKNLHTGYGGISDNTQYFTPKPVVDYMIGALKVIGFNGGKVLEPSCGNGIFINAIKNSFENTNITGIELNAELFSINKLCYPYAELINGNTLNYIEEFKDKYDLVIGNPPYGSSKKNDELPLGKNTLEGQFFELSAKAVKKGGYLALVLPTSILSSQKHIKLRESLLEDFVLLSVVQLPSTTFYFSGTSVSASIVMLRRKVNLEETYNYSISMAMIDSIGWDSKGNSNNNELIPLLNAFKIRYDENNKDINLYFK